MIFYPRKYSVLLKYYLIAIAYEHIRSKVFFYSAPTWSLKLHQRTHNLQFILVILLSSRNNSKFHIISIILQQMKMSPLAQQENGNRHFTAPASQQNKHQHSRRPGSDDSSMIYASDINNTAAMHLQKGHHEVAIAELSTALATLSKRLRMLAGVNSAGGSLEQGGMNVPKPILGFVPESGGSLFKDTYAVNKNGANTDSKPQSNEQEGHGRFVFRSPVYIQNVDALLPITNTFEALSYVVIYNLALAFQLSGLAADDDALRTVRLRKALWLYEHTNKILQHGKFVADPLHYMAVLCNMGAIYNFFNEDARAAVCQESLLSAAMHCIVGGIKRPAQWASIVEVFLSNMRLVTAGVAPAA
jgi:hypothetical protein